MMLRYLQHRHTQRNSQSKRILPLLLLLALLFGSMVEARPTQAAALAQSGVQRIYFAPGATSAVVGGNLSGGEVARYVLRAIAGQLMTVQATSNGAPVIVTIFDPNRNIMGYGSTQEQWSGILPITGDYGFNVYPPPYAASVDYQIRIEITYTSQPTPTAQPTAAPERIQFAPGAVSAQVTGYLASGTSKAYVLGARAGQVMTVASWSSGGPFRVTIADATGMQLGTANQGESWSGVLPRNGDYRITLQSPAGAPSTNYGMQVTIVNSAPPPTSTPIPPPSAQRIRFQQGATNTSVWGYVDSSSPIRYVLYALAGQVMSVSLSTQHGYPARVTIRTQQSTYLGGADAGQSWSGTLPASQDYYLEVQSPADSSGDNFTLWIDIR